MSVLGTGCRVFLEAVCMYSGGKSPKQECCDLGNILLFEGFHFLAEVIVKSFFMWSSLIMLALTDLCMTGVADGCISFLSSKIIK